MRHAPVLVAIALVALVASACGRLADAQAPPTTFDPLTVTIPPPAIDAATPPEPGVLRLTGRDGIASGLLRAAGSTGLFAREGVSVRFAPAATDAEVESALIDGSVDGAVVPTWEALDLAEQDVPIHVVLLLTSSNTDDVILARSGIDGVSGLAGQRLAFAAGGDELVVREALGREGVVPAAVERIETPEPAALLARGDVDAAVVDAVDAARLQAGDDGFVVLYAAGERPGLISHALVVRDAVTASRPGQLLAIVRAWQDVYVLDRDDPPAMAARMAPMLGAPAEEVLTTLEATALYDVPANAVELFPGGEYHDTTVAAVAAHAREAGWNRGAVTAAELIDPVFAQAVATAG